MTTISQAIREIADLKGKIKNWTDQMQDSVLVQADNPPPFKFEKVCEARNHLVERMVMLSTALAVANATTFVVWNGKTIPLALAVRTLSELRALKDCVKKLNVRHSPNGTDVERNAEYDDEGKRFFAKTEKPWQCAMPTAEKLEKLDALQDRFNKLNDLVESTNGKTLIEETVSLPDASL